MNVKEDIYILLNHILKNIWLLVRKCQNVNKKISLMYYYMMLQKETSENNTML